MKDTNISDRICYSVTWVMSQGWHLGALGVPRGAKKIKHGQVAYQINGDEEQNRMQLKIFILRSNLWPWDEVKRSNIIKFWLPCQFQIFLYQSLCVFSQIKDRKHIEQNFHSFAGVMPQGWDLGVLGVKNFRVGICDGAPSTAHSSFNFQFVFVDNPRRQSFTQRPGNSVKLGGVTYLQPKPGSLVRQTSLKTRVVAA